MDFFQRIFSSGISRGSDTSIACLQNHGAILNSLPQPFSGLSAVYLKNNLAVIPGDWTSQDVVTPFYDIEASEPCMSNALTEIKSADFIAWDESFFDIIGVNAKLEAIQVFTPANHHVHEAPVYLPETNELLYSDTTVVGSMYAINIDTHNVRTIVTNPPLHNINGGTLHRGIVYVATNGDSVRGIYSLNVTTGKAEAVVNNYRGRRFNSPNDLVFDSSSNMYFTDPTYGWDQSWGGVQQPELPRAIYKFDLRSKALTALSNSVVNVPNGLALSVDESILYVADSSSTSMQLDSQRAVFAFDVNRAGLSNPRLIYQIAGGWPDGLRVTRGGLLMVAVSGGVDVIDPRDGRLLGRINTPDDIVFNLEPARGKGVWLLTGQKKIYKVSIKEGPALYSSLPLLVNQVRDVVESLRKRVGV